MSGRIKIGDRVQSHYRARWFGVATAIQKRNGMGSLIGVWVTHDKVGRLQRKAFHKRLDEAWLTVENHISLRKV